MKKYLSLLKWIWLPEKAAMIYLSLLEKWLSSITEIQNDINIHRAEIYRLLPLLLEEWFIKVFLKWKRKFYLPASPKKIEEAYKDLQEKNRWTINVLLDKYSNLDKKPNVIYNEWKKWITSVFNDIIDSQNKWDVFYRVTSEIDTETINKKYLPKNYREKRDKKELERYVIMSHKASEHKKYRPERDLVIIPKKIDEFDDNVFMSIYADKVAYIDFNTESSIIIENKQIADFQKKLFRLLFKSLK
jgi:hypothetical protein